MLVALDIRANELLSNAGYAMRIGKKNGGASSSGFSPEKKRLAVAEGPPPPPPPPPQGEAEQAAEVEPARWFDVEFASDGKLGLSFGSEAKGRRVVVVEVKAGGLAGTAINAGLIGVGDELVAIHGMPTAGLRLVEVVGMIRAASRPLVLRFESARPGLPGNPRYRIVAPEPVPVPVPVPVPGVEPLAVAAREPELDPALAALAALDAALEGSPVTPASPSVSAIDESPVQLEPEQALGGGSPGSGLAYMPSLRGAAGAAPQLLDSPAAAAAAGSLSQR